MLWEFYKYEDKHGTKATAYDIQANGASRHFIFCNNPKKQRICKCQKCRTRIPREVPRLLLEGAYYYGSGYYCLSCGNKLIQERRKNFQATVDLLQKEMKNLDLITATAKLVMADDFYSKRMALGRMLQVMTNEDEK